MSMKPPVDRKILHIETEDFNDLDYTQIGFKKSNNTAGYKNSDGDITTYGERVAVTKEFNDVGLYAVINIILEDVLHKGEGVRVFITSQDSANNGVVAEFDIIVDTPVVGSFVPVKNAIVSEIASGGTVIHEPKINGNFITFIVSQPLATNRVSITTLPIGDCRVDRIIQSNTTPTTAPEIEDTRGGGNAGGDLRPVGFGKPESVKVNWKWTNGSSDKTVVTITITLEDEMDIQFTDDDLDGNVNSGTTASIDIDISNFSSTCDTPEESLVFVYVKEITSSGDLTLTWGNGGYDPTNPNYGWNPNLPSICTVVASRDSANGCAIKEIVYVVDDFHSNSVSVPVRGYINKGGSWVEWGLACAGNSPATISIQEGAIYNDDILYDIQGIDDNIVNQPVWSVVGNKYLNLNIGNKNQLESIFVKNDSGVIKYLDSNDNWVDNPSAFLVVVRPATSYDNDAPTVTPPNTYGLIVGESVDLFSSGDGGGVYTGGEADSSAIDVAMQRSITSAFTQFEVSLLDESVVGIGILVKKDTSTGAEVHIRDVSTYSNMEIIHGSWLNPVVSYNAITKNAYVSTQKELFDALESVNIRNIYVTTDFSMTGDGAYGDMYVGGDKNIYGAPFRLNVGDANNNTTLASDHPTTVYAIFVYADLYAPVMSAGSEGHLILDDVIIRCRNLYTSVSTVNPLNITTNGSSEFTYETKYVLGTNDVTPNVVQKYWDNTGAGGAGGSTGAYNSVNVMSANNIVSGVNRGQLFIKPTGTGGSVIQFKDVDWIVGDWIDITVVNGSVTTTPLSGNIYGNATSISQVHGVVRVTYTATAVWTQSQSVGLTSVNTGSTITGDGSSSNPIDVAHPPGFGTAGQMLTTNSSVNGYSWIDVLDPGDVTRARYDESVTSLLEAGYTTICNNSFFSPSSSNPVDLRNRTASGGDVSFVGKALTSQCNDCTWLVGAENATSRSVFFNSGIMLWKNHYDLTIELNNSGVKVYVTAIIASTGQGYEYSNASGTITLKGNGIFVYEYVTPGITIVNPTGNVSIINERWSSSTL